MGGGGFMSDIFGGGGSSTTIIQPTPQPQPSTAEAIQEYVKSLPEIYQAQLDYAPKEAQQQLALMEQYGAPYSEAYKNIQEQLYPGTTAIQENLANQALQGMQNPVNEQQKAAYLSNLRANLGTNAGAPIAADYTSRGLMQLEDQWRQYYTNLALNVSGRQPLTQATSPSYTNMLQNYTPQSALGFQSQNYGTYVAGSRPLLGQESYNRTGVIPAISGLMSAMRPV